MVVPVITNWYCPSCARCVAGEEVLGMAEGTAKHVPCKTLVERRRYRLRSAIADEVKETEDGKQVH